MKRLARLASLTLAGLYLAVFAAGLAARWRELSVVCAAEPCPILGLRIADVQALERLGLSLRFYANYQAGIELAAGLLHLVPAAVLYWRRGDAWLALLAALALAGFGTSVLAEAPSALARVYPELSGLTTTLQSLAGLLFAWLLFAFPNGRLVPAWAWVAGVPLLGVTILNAIFRPTVTSAGPLRLVVLGILVVTGVSGVLAQIYRYCTKSTALERQQTKAVLLGLACMAANLVIWMLVVEIFPPQPGSARLAAYVLGVGLTAVLWAMLPISLAVAILRYRLWDIDLLIRRTLTYSVLTATLALVYLAAVISLQAMVRLVTGQEQSPLVVVLSTLLIAALFGPVRRRWQEAIDRRFYRQRYDAAQVLAAFGAGLREEVDLDALAKRLVTTVDETMQPASVSLWLRGKAGKTGD